MTACHFRLQPDPTLSCQLIDLKVDACVDAICAKVRLIKINTDYRRLCILSMA